MTQASPPSRHHGLYSRHGLHFALTAALAVAAIAVALPPAHAHTGHHVDTDTVTQTGNARKTASAPRGALFGRTVHDLHAERRLADQEGKPLAVLFEQEDCTACAAFRQRVLPHRAATRAARSWRTVSVRLDSPVAITTPAGEPTSAPDFAHQLRVQGTPAIAFFDHNGRLTYRHQGPIRDGQEFALLLQFVRDAHFDAMPFAEFVRQSRPQRSL